LPGPVATATDHSVLNRPLRRTKPTSGNIRARPDVICNRLPCVIDGSASAER
jgi:hypothetical protein